MEDNYPSSTGLIGQGLDVDTPGFDVEDDHGDEEETLTLVDPAEQREKRDQRDVKSTPRSRALPADLKPAAAEARALVAKIAAARGIVAGEETTEEQVLRIIRDARARRAMAAPDGEPSVQDLLDVLRDAAR